MRNSKWLFDEHPIVIDRDLAAEFGLNESIVLQQLNYWLNGKSAKFIDGRYWIYNSYKQWQKDNFPFWSLATVRRAIESCEKQGLVITANYNRAGFDKTKWYSIDYQKVNKGMSKRCAQNEQTSCSKWADGVAQNGQTNTRDYTETTTEITSKDIYSQAEPDGVAVKVKTVIDYLNEKTDSHYKATTPKTKQLVQARLKEGFTVDDFKTVIDKKTATWLKDSKMNKYLRPLTLFGTKFEDYLNEKIKGVPDQNKNDPYYTEKINPMTGQPDPNGLTRYQMDNEYW